MKSNSEGAQFSNTHLQSLSNVFVCGFPSFCDIQGVDYIRYIDLMWWRYTMNQAEHLSDRVEAVQLDRGRHRELQRRERVFNDKFRTIGVDKDALDHQVKERREKEQRQANELKVYADELLCSDRAACILEQRQKKDDHLLNEAIVQFRQQFQQPASRREFDLNDPELLKKQEGVRILPGLTGEDLAQKNRLRKQQEQLRAWTLQQQDELERAKQELQQEMHQYDQSRLALDTRALELQKMEEQGKRAAAITTKDFNLALAAEITHRHLQEHHEEEENNQTDILNQLNGDLLMENPEQNISVLGLSRLRRDYYKGMSPKELQQYTQYQLQQAVDRKRAVMEQREKELQEHHERMTSARAALLLERHQARINKELRRAMDNTNAQLAQAHDAQNKHLQDVYTNIPDERYFSQFNTSSR